MEPLFWVATSLWKYHTRKSSQINDDDIAVLVEENRHRLKYWTGLISLPIIVWGMQFVAEVYKSGFLFKTAPLVVEKSTGSQAFIAKR